MGARPGTNNNGGPATEAGRARAIANFPGKGAPGRALVHGMTSPFAMWCDRCKVAPVCETFEAGAVCAIEAQYTVERRKALLAVEHIDAILDAPAVEQVISTELRVGRGLRALAYLGEFMEEGEAGANVLAYQPMVATLTSLQRLHLSQSEALKLTPAGRVSGLLTKNEDARRLAAVRALFEDEDEPNRKDDDDDD